MAVNLGTYLGLVGAGLVVMVGAKYISKRIKKEVKVYGEGQISVAEEIKDSRPGEFGRGRGRTNNEYRVPEIEGTQSDAIYREQQNEVEGIDERRGGIPSEFSEHPREHQREHSELNKADKPSGDSVELYSQSIPDVDPI